MDNINLSFVNDCLEDLGIDFKLKPVGSGARLYWIFEATGLYAIKVPAVFVQSLERRLTEGVSYRASIYSLFGDNFVAEIKSPFALYSGIGFIAKDYAEFYLSYEQLWQDIEGPDSFFVGNTEI